MKKVSVIVPCYNAARYLNKCIDQLLCQTIGINNIEIILVDDASADEGETKKVIQGYEQRFSETITAVFLENNMRQGGARNVGMIYAEGEYLMFCDADDWLLAEALEHTYHTAKRYDADVVFFGRKNVAAHGFYVQLEKGDKDALFELEETEKRKKFLLNTEQPGYSSQNALFKRSLIKENHITFAEHLIMEEPSFTVPVRLYAKRCCYLDESLYICYLSSESTLRNNHWELRKWDNLQMWIGLIENLEARAIFSAYQKEIEYLFFTLGVGWSLSTLFIRRCILTKEEWKIFADIMQKMLPAIKENPYIKNIEHPFNRAWNDLLFKVLDMDFTDENVEMVNQAMTECTRAFSMCPVLC